MSYENKPYRGGTTPYYEDILDALILLAKEGRGNISQFDVAGAANRKVTAPLRRALNHAIGQGAIVRRDVKTDKGGVAANYIFTEKFVQYVLELSRGNE